MAALSVGAIGLLLGDARPLTADEPNPVTAIDILLEPDATMVQHARAANERLLKEFPKGFALGKTHQPHISCLQRYVKTADLDKIYEAVGKVLVEEKPSAWKLKAYKYYYLPWKDIGLAGIVIEPTADLLRYQKKLLDAVEPFTVKTGTAAAFVTTKEDPDINQPTIDYVKTFVPNETGKKFNPHVTIGIATQTYLKRMLEEQFEEFTFSPVGASVYHLGNFGTARKKLESWELRNEQGNADPLPSWKGPAKKALLEFVRVTTDKTSNQYVPSAQRIATFDQDGTLWVEHPMYTQVVYCLERLAVVAKEKPELKKVEPFKTVLSGDRAAMAKLSLHDLEKVLAVTLSGMTVDEFRADVKDWLAKARHPRFNRLYTDLVYQPMLELLGYMRANGFKTYIVSGGGVEFMRPWVEKVYGIPPEQVVGSSGVVKFEMRPDGNPALMKLAKVEFIDDGAGKPVGINRFIGRRPIFAFGNSDGDHQMLQWTVAGPGARFAGIVHHTDADREWAYDRQSHIGKLDKALDEGRTKGWTVVDMKRDWRKVFAFEP